MQQLDVDEATTGDQQPRERDRIGAALDADNRSGPSHALRKRVEEAARTGAELDHLAALERPDLVEQPGRLAAELLGLSLQPALLGRPIAEEVLVCRRSCGWH